MPHEVLPGRRWRLKSATNSDHQRVDALNTQFSMFGSLPAYQGYLAATLASRAQLEAVLEASEVEAFVPDWKERKIVLQLHEDIRDLGCDEAALPDVLADPVGMPSIIGTLYVLEGSGLGARILIKQAAKLGLSGSLGARHLARQIDNLGSWRDMLQLIDETPLGDEESCIRAARAAFGVFASNYEKVFGDVT
ncbi:MAG: hypothetical protein E6Q76_07260 [Rhizobium sp.]|nr:MAG: hypothetical protein E6Q76_07260 [Rhizobium sp.]